MAKVPEGGNGSDRGMPEEDNVAAQNASSRQYDWRPRPDPTVLTTMQLRATEENLNRTILERVAGLRELLEGRLDGMDEATKLIAERMVSQGTSIDLKSKERHDTLQALFEQRLASMDRATELLSAQLGQVPRDSADARDRVREEFAAADLALRELLGSRIDGMDVATKLLAHSVELVPTDIDREVSAVKEIMQAMRLRLEDVLSGEIKQVQAVTSEKFNAVDALFASNATALTAALAAQEKAVAEQNKSNTLAIDKSEQATKETIAANANQTSTGLAGLGTVMDDLKSRVVRLEGLTQNTRQASEDSLALGTFGQTAEQNRIVQGRANIQLMLAAISGLVAIIAVIFAVVKK